LNGLAAGTDVSFLVGASLTQVCVGQNEVILNLSPAGDPWTDPGASITVQSAIRLVLPTEMEFTSDAPVLIGPALLPILGSAVAGAAVVQPGTLRLTWSSGHVLDIIDSVEHYESYIVTHGDKVTVV
jgi:hypothetical protein